jgi:hypothetical protein
MNRKKTNISKGKEERKSLTESIAEAEARGLDFDPATRMKDVEYLLKNIPRLKSEGKSKTEIQEKLSDLYEKYPELFKKIYAGEDLAQLELMMKMMIHMERNELTPHQASVIVGRQLANDYIPDELKNEK